MNKILKMVGTASLVGSMLVFAGCGGGGGSDDNGTVTPPTEVTTEVTASGTSTATTAKDIYKFAANDINFTITGFAAGDVLSFPVGSVVTVENGSFADNAAVIKSVSAGKEVRVTLAGLTADVDGRLNRPDAFDAEFGAGTVASH